MRTSRWRRPLPGTTVRSQLNQERRARRAFTLVEVVVACMVFVTGVLALQAAATVVLRQSQDARNQALSAEVAASRFESFVHEPCTDAPAGAEVIRGVRSEWSAGPPAARDARLSNQAISFTRGRVRRADVYEGAYRCR